MSQIGGNYTGLGVPIIGGSNAGSSARPTLIGRRSTSVDTVTGPTTITNAQKLAGTYAVGDEVYINDAFVTKDCGDTTFNRFWFPHTSANGRMGYVTVLLQDGSSGNVIWNGVDAWEMHSISPDESNDIIVYQLTQDVAHPWLGTVPWSAESGEGPGPTVVYPAHQRLTAPDPTDERAWAIVATDGTQAMAQRWLLAAVDDLLYPIDNNEKLSLLPSTPVGTEVSVSDGFVVNSVIYPEIAGLYVRGGTFFGRNYYYKADKGNSDPNNATSVIGWYDGEWDLYDEDGGLFSSSLDDVAEPWLAAWSVGTLDSFAHPAIQQLAAPSSAQGGMSLSTNTLDSDAIDNSGIYAIAGTGGGKTKYCLLGQEPSSDIGNPGIIAYGTLNGVTGWYLTDVPGDVTYYSAQNVATPDLINITHQDVILKIAIPSNIGSHPDGDSSGSFGVQGSGVPIVLTTGNDVSTSSIDQDAASNADGLVNIGIADSPTRAAVIAQLVAAGGGKVVDNGDGSINVTITSDWLLNYTLDTSTDSAGCTITVLQAGRQTWPTITSISKGELDAGVTVAGAGTPEANGVIYGPEISADSTHYGLEILTQRPPNNNRAGRGIGNGWSIGSVTAGGYFAPDIGGTNVTFPWQVTNLAPDDGDAPAPTVTRNDVATEANWEIVP